MVISLSRTFLQSSPVGVMSISCDTFDVLHPRVEQNIVLSYFFAEFEFSPALLSSPQVFFVHLVLLSCPWCADQTKQAEPQQRRRLHEWVRHPHMQLLRREGSLARQWGHVWGNRDAVRKGCEASAVCGHVRVKVQQWTLFPVQDRDWHHICRQLLPVFSPEFLFFKWNEVGWWKKNGVTADTKGRNITSSF